MSFITVKNLWKEYGAQVVLENLSLEIKQGEFCTLVGASGCGKSTFLKMLLGQEQASRGTLNLEGEPFPPQPDRNRGIVFQRYSVFPHLSVRENVLMGLELEPRPVLGRLFGNARREALVKVDAMLAAVGLSGAANKWPHELSGGMQQRLAIAQSFLMRPRVLLLDEPFGALDPGIRNDMHQLLLRLWKETGTTIFMVTHDLHEGFHLGTRLLVFDKIRRDPHDPQAFGATITYDLPIGRTDERLLEDIEANLSGSEACATPQHNLHRINAVIRG